MHLKKILVSSTVLLSLFTFATPVSAHVVVKPSEVGVGQRANFSVSVPTEEDVPTTELKLVLPEGLQSVRPNVKPGWTIELKKNGTGEDAKITEIIWKGGKIPADQRDEFVFSAQAPATESSIVWKAYQTYADGEVVAWDSDPKAVEEYTKSNPTKPGEHDDKAPEPYSVTVVKNDLKAAPAETVTPDMPSKNNEFVTVGIIAAVVMSAASLWMQILKR